MILVLIGMSYQQIGKNALAALKHIEIVLGIVAYRKDILRTMSNLVDGWISREEKRIIYLRDNSRN